MARIVDFDGEAVKYCYQSYRTQSRAYETVAAHVFIGRMIQHILPKGFQRVRCEGCHHERLVAFSCKKRGFCPSCGARRMAESSALLVDEVFPEVPIRQFSPWMACIRAMQEQLPRVLSFLFQLRFLLARYPELMGEVLGIVYRQRVKAFDPSQTRLFD